MIAPIDVPSHHVNGDVMRQERPNHTDMGVAARSPSPQRQTNDRTHPLTLLKAKGLDAL
jgi:hypothetical protein